jgi:hypothetical protein
MAKHRSLSNALLSPEKMAFITGQEGNQASNAQDLQPPVQSNAVVVPVVELAAEASSDSPETPPVKKPSVKRAQPIEDRPAARTTTLPANDDYLVAITTRLQARTAEALRRAYLEQKLNRREPATQQEIIELAVQQWLCKSGFLD